MAKLTMLGVIMAPDMQVSREYAVCCLFELTAHPKHVPGECNSIAQVSCYQRFGLNAGVVAIH